ncbi:hypothetical protein LP421_27340 [Rhizobium sp. RCAM05350]|nr:hypothetical protein LP421_27340 [Rhizobium sp. RCAM05350]
MRAHSLITVQRNAEPWTPQASFTAKTKAGKAEFSAVFTATEKDTAQIIFQLGGAQKPWRVCLDDVAIQETQPDGVEAAAQQTLYALPALVNQTGYFLDGPKRDDPVGCPGPTAVQARRWQRCCGGRRNGGARRL